jgi:alkylhydroperoxidase family enzyme
MTIFSETRADEETSLRLPPVSDAAWPAEAAHLREGFAGRLNIYRVMAHHPALLNAWESLRNHVVLANALTPRQQELTILRAAYRWRAGYEWAHHVSRGRKAGLGDAEIAAAGGAADRLPANDEAHALFAAVDELLDEGALSSSTQNRLSENLDKTAVLDLMATVGMYTTLAFLAKTFNPPLEPELEALEPRW